jgi:hypothetical protein
MEGGTVKPALLLLFPLLLPLSRLSLTVPSEALWTHGGCDVPVSQVSAATDSDGLDDASDPDNDAPDDESCLLETVALYPNLPNPFNPETEIGFDLPRTMPVSVAVYDILGQHVVTLASGVLTGGHHAVYFNGSTLPSGSYYCKLVAPDITQTQKMILLK